MKRFKRSELITVFCVSLLLGLGISRKVYIQPGLWVFFLLPLVLIFQKKNLASLAAVAVVALCLGIIRGDIYMVKSAQLYHLSGHNVTIHLTAKNDAVYSDKSQLEFSADHLQLISPSKRSLAGSAKIKGFGVPMVYRGDELEVTGKVFQSRGSNQIRLSFAQLKITKSGDDLGARLTRNFSTGMENSVPEPQASFALGLLVGQRTNLPKDILTSLTAVGLVHIVAVSGYNLTVLTRAVGRLKLGSKYQRTLAALMLITLFLLTTGFSASIVRAAIISTLSIWAAFFGRKIKPLVLITVTAALTAYVNPFYLWSDIGWYLSFLAFFGVLIIGPLISNKLFKKTPRLLTLVVIETLSAEIMTLPVIMMIFGKFSLISLLANLVVVPLVPLAMALSAVAALAGLVTPLYAGWFAFPATLLLTFMLDVAHLLSGVPGTVINLKIDPTLTIGLYTLIVMALLAEQVKSKRRTT